jgi:hypothetical protein
MTYRRHDSSPPYVIGRVMEKERQVVAKVNKMWMFPVLSKTLVHMCVCVSSGDYENVPSAAFNSGAHVCMYEYTYVCVYVYVCMYECKPKVKIMWMFPVLSKSLVHMYVCMSSGDYVDVPSAL